MDLDKDKMELELDQFQDMLNESKMQLAEIQKLTDEANIFNEENVQAKFVEEKRLAQILEDKVTQIQALEAQLADLKSKYEFATTLRKCKREVRSNSKFEENVREFIGRFKTIAKNFGWDIKMKRINDCFCQIKIFFDSNFLEVTFNEMDETFDLITMSPQHKRFDQIRDFLLKSNDLHGLCIVFRDFIKTQSSATAAEQSNLVTSITAEAT